MPTLTEFLADYFAALIALLRRAARIDFHNLNTGAFSLVLEDVHETGPAGIGDRTAYPARDDGKRVRCKGWYYWIEWRADHFVVVNDGKPYTYEPDLQDCEAEWEVLTDA